MLNDMTKKSGGELIQAITSDSKIITLEDFQGYYRNMMQYILKCF